MKHHIHIYMYSYRIHLISDSLLIRVLNGRDRARHYLQVMDKSRLFMTNNGLRRLPVLWTKTVQRDVLIFALDVYVDVVLIRTPYLNEETTLTRLLRR